MGLSVVSPRGLLAALCEDDLIDGSYNAMFIKFLAFLASSNACY